jgi:hypothetical protein
MGNSSFFNRRSLITAAGGLTALSSGCGGGDRKSEDRYTTNEHTTHKDAATSTRRGIGSEEGGGSFYWPQFAYDPQNTGHNPHSNINGTPEVGWKYQTEGNELCSVLMDNIAFIVAKMIDETSRLVAINAVTGEEIASIELEQSPDYITAINDKRVYAGGALYELQNNSFSKVWSFSLEGKRARIWPGIYSNDIIYAGVWE